MGYFLFDFTVEWCLVFYDDVDVNSGDILFVREITFLGAFFFPSSAGNCVVGWEQMYEADAVCT